MSTFTFVTTVTCSTVDQARHVMAERLSHDEDLGFDYEVYFQPDTAPYVLLIGTLTDGLQLIGPFDTASRIADYVAVRCTEPPDVCEALTLHRPEGLAPQVTRLAHDSDDW